MNPVAATIAIRRVAASLLLLAFACAQFVEFAHQDEHAGFDADKRCVVCVQLDKPGSVAEFSATVANPSFAATVSPVAREQVASPTMQSRPPARAPPRA